MAFNVMDMVLKQLTPDNIKAVAGMLGEDQGKVSSAMSGAAPAILGGLVSAFSEPSGRQAFERQLDQADGGIMDNLAGMLGGSGGSSLVNTGASMLGSLMGDNKMGMLASALSSFSGMSSDSTKSLLGLATPMLLGMLKSKGKSDGLGASGLIDMLMGQKDNIAGALPPQLGSALSGTGLLDGVLGKAGGAATAAAAATTAAGKQAADKGGSLLGKLIPLILLVLVAWLVYQFLIKPGDEPTGSSSVGSVGAVQLSDQLELLMGQAGSVLSGINSVEDARNALSSLESVDRGLGQLLSTAANLPSGQTQKLAANFAKLAPPLESAVGHAYNVPGARDVLSGTVDSILRKLKVISEG
jgi:hypothetical protein